MGHPINYDDFEVKEFLEAGFSRTKGNIIAKLRARGVKYQIFSADKCSKGGYRYGQYALFGVQRFKYVYDMERKSEFIEYLTALFNEVNPDASIGLRRAFTKILHNNRL